MSGLGSGMSHFVLEFLCIVRSPRVLVIGVLVANWRGGRWWLLGLSVSEVCGCLWWWCCRGVLVNRVWCRWVVPLPVGCRVCVLLEWVVFFGESGVCGECELWMCSGCSDMGEDDVLLAPFHSGGVCAGIE